MKKSQLLDYTVSSINFIKKQALAQVFSCEFYEISKNTFFYSGGCFWFAAVNCCYTFILKLPSQIEICNDVKSYF